MDIKKALELAERRVEMFGGNEPDSPSTIDMLAFALVDLNQLYIEIQEQLQR